MGLIVFGAFQRRYERDLADITDLRAGLVWFMEHNEGRFPSSEEEFVASPVVERLPDGALRISCRTRYPFPGWARGNVVSDIGRFHIRWGTDVSTLCIDHAGTVRDASGNEVLLIQWPGDTEFSRIYTRQFLEASRQVVGVGPVPGPPAHQTG
jgi:hypothetical protein